MHDLTSYYVYHFSSYDTLITYYSLELCAALILAFLALDSSSFFALVLAEEAADEDGKLRIHFTYN